MTPITFLPRQPLRSKPTSTLGSGGLGGSTSALNPVRPCDLGLKSGLPSARRGRSTFPCRTIPAMRNGERVLFFFPTPAANRHRRRRDQVRLLGVRVGQPAGPLGHPRLQDAPRQQQRHHLLLQPPHALRHPHVVRPGQRKPPGAAATLR